MQNAPFGTLRPAGDLGDAGARCRVGQRLLELTDAYTAAEVFQEVVATAAPRAAAWAEQPDLHEALRHAVAGLDDCLALLHGAEARQAAFQALFQVYQADAGASPNGLTREIPFILLRHATPAERYLLRTWVRSTLAAGAPSGAAEACWRLLLDLDSAQPASLEAVLAECRAAGYAGLVAEKLLDLDRVGEALSAARRDLQDAEALLHFANSPAARGQVRAVMALVAERLEAGFDRRLAGWLAARYEERGDLPRALELRLESLRQAPGHGDYERVATLARRLGTWEQLRPDVAHTLAHNGRDEALVELALGEGDPARALPYVVGAPERYGPEVLARLAAYAATAQPEQALTLYRHLLERALAGQPAAGDAEAHLKRLREVYDHLGALDEWEACLEELHEQYGLRVWG
ncbi:MAG TPA: hypothetical protein PLJ35_03875 [Anaerolineae bacterium]|nr:hypothetical protein [Anaerolineae bacterium]HOQ97941.1 hypothetical protein [Anaerolineae bacterium]HPL27691.1 hypothetical protein [Anaerolineae bacterium]